jgi:polysaccharide export outer membrane protein
MRYITFVYLFVSFALTSCSLKPNQVLLQQNNNGTDTAAVKSYANISNYRIRPHDILQITNVQASKSLIDLTAGVSQSNSAISAAQAQPDNLFVEDDGTIALTGLGRIKVAGLTRIQARNYLEDLYSRKILTNPLLELKIVNLKVTMLGEVKAAGPVLLTHDNTTLVEILGQAGGLTEKADNTTVKIIRAGQTPKTDIIDLSDAKILSDPRIIVQNDDIVVVAPNKRAIRTEKLQDFSTIAAPVLLVINTTLLIFTLIRR